MRNFYKGLLSLIMVGFLYLPTTAQGQYWTARTVKEGIVTHKAVARQAFPKDFTLFDLSIVPLRQQLFSIVGDNAAQRTTVISLPNTKGKMEQFKVVEASNFEPALQARYPEIRAFSGSSLETPGSLLKISISPLGIQTTVFRADGPNEYIEPYSQDGKTYAIFQSSRKKGDLPWLCSTPDQQLALELNRQVYLNRTESSAGQLKTMRLAQSCNGEYANYFGATSVAGEGLVLAAFNATLTRTNGCYEKDLAIHLNLIPTTTQVIYYNPTTDPYTTMGAWNGQLQATLNSVIGAANYDIGHMFGASGGGGNAGCIGCVCNDANKGSGITSPADGIPQGDNFDIDYVAHEVGHQLGANHTFSMSLESAGVNKEVGSGITIMGYAGITGQDVAPHSIDIFHQASIQQVQVNMVGKTCPVTTSLASTNATPVVATPTPYTIPITTPFELTGSATDANTSDVLTYCWEQNDNSTTTGANSVASPTKVTGPNWLTFPATTSPTRTFPRLSTILAGLSVTGPLPGGDAGANIEALSSVARTLNFRLTVRDNVPYSSANLVVGQTNFADVAITVSAAVGPFLITSHNTAATLTAGQVETLTWSVNGTTGAPTNTSNVEILISTDGGTTFTTLLASTANDGTESFTVPNTPSSQVRFKVRAIGNIYFDINNANLTIIPPAFGFGFTQTTPATAACPAPNSMSITLNTVSNGGYTGNISLTASGNPAGTTVSFNPSTVAVGGSTVVTLNGTNTLNAGTYTITVAGTATGAPNQTASLSFTVNAGSGPTITTQPANQTGCLGGSVTYTVAASGGTYQWQLNTGSGFANISGATSTTLTVSALTTSMTGYQYRCVVNGQCGSTTSSTASLTVNTLPEILNQPVGLTQCTGTSATFTVGATGTAITYQWQVSTDGGANYSNITGATTATYTIASTVLSQNNNRYRCVVSGACTPAVTSTAATLTLSAAPTINTQPITSATICEGGSTSFTVAASTPIGTLSYQWQASANGGTSWTNVAGASTSTLNQSNVPAAQNGYLFRVGVTTSCGTIYSTNTTLTVNTYPVISFSPISQLCLSDQSVALTATPAGGTFAGAGVTGTTFNPRTAGVGAKAVTYTASNAGCQSSVSRTIIVDQCAERQIPLENPASLTLYPNPNTGRFGVRVNTDLYTKFNVKVFNSLGQIVRTQDVANVFFGQVLNMDLSRLPAGTYHLLFINDEQTPVVSRTINMVIYK